MFLKRYIDSNDDTKAAINYFDALLNSYEAVSYTHLRAHETLANLVCRLLLEKKKGGGGGGASKIKFCLRSLEGNLINTKYI